MSTQLAHRMHEPQEEPLGDVGFKYLPVREERKTPLQVLRASSAFDDPHGRARPPYHYEQIHSIPNQSSTHTLSYHLSQELGLQNAWVSETIFLCLFIPFILWTFSPFVTARKRFYTAVLYARILVVLSACQALRIISFSVTQLPAPNYHCRASQETAVREMPRHWWGHIVVDLGRQATHGCGDLIFSSHTTFVLVGVLTFTEYGETLLLKVSFFL
jgi:sphingomyelin synthase-related protein 1